MDNRNNQAIVHERDNALSQMLAACTKPSEITLVSELYVTAINAKTEIDPRLNGEFLREFSGYSPESLAWAFQQWRRQSPHLPGVSEMCELLERYAAHRQIEIATVEFRAARIERKKLLTSGERVLTEAEIEAIREEVRRSMKRVTLRGHQFFTLPTEDQLRDRANDAKQRLAQWIEKRERCG